VKTEVFQPIRIKWIQDWLSKELDTRSIAINPRFNKLIPELRTAAMVASSLSVSVK
jgi:hypothetical protein